METPQAKPEMILALGIAGYALSIETLGMLARKGIITPQEGAAVIEAALSSTEMKQSEAPHPALAAACELLGTHQAMWFQPPGD